MLNKLGLSIITMFGIGYIKLAPGTFASLATCIIYFFLFKIIFSQIEINYLNYLIFFLIFIFFIGIYLIDNVKNNFKKKDASEIVIDEFLGTKYSINFSSVYANKFRIIRKKYNNFIFS